MLTDGVEQQDSHFVLGTGSDLPLTKRKQFLEDTEQGWLFSVPILVLCRHQGGRRLYAEQYGVSGILVLLLSRQRTLQLLRNELEQRQIPRRALPHLYAHQLGQLLKLCVTVIMQLHPCPPL